jgi:hypothetical protein
VETPQPDQFIVPLPDGRGGPPTFVSPVLATDALGALGAFGWAVPGLVISVPGLAILLVVAAQVAGGLAWIPVARRRIGGFGLGGRRGRRRPA